eukprot:s722_g4.t1
MSNFSRNRRLGLHRSFDFEPFVRLPSAPVLLRRSTAMSRTLVLLFVVAGIVWLAHPKGAFVPSSLRPPRTYRLPRHAEALSPSGLWG